MKVYASVFSTITIPHNLLLNGKQKPTFQPIPWGLFCSSCEWIKTCEYHINVPSITVTVKGSWSYQIALSNPHHVSANTPFHNSILLIISNCLKQSCPHKCSYHNSYLVCTGQLSQLALPFSKESWILRSVFHCHFSSTRIWCYMKTEAYVKK